MSKKLKLVTDTKRMVSIFIDHENYDWLKAEAERTGLSLAELVRRSVTTTRGVAQAFGGSKAA